MAASQDTELRLHRFAEPTSAFGLAVSYLMTMPAFLHLPFGSWSQTLAGQVNRNHYVFACRGDMVEGFAGWAFADMDEAEDWLADGSEPASGGRSGDCLIINCWAVSSDQANRMLIRQLRRVGANKRAVYAKRRYPDGRTRNLRLNATPSVVAKLDRLQSPAAR